MAGVTRREVALAKEASDRSIAAAWEAHQREHDNAAKAIERAEVSLNSRLEGMNQIRGQLDRQAATFVTRDAYDGQAEKYDAVFRALATKHDADIDLVRGQIQVEREVRKTLEGSITTWRWIASFLGVGGIGGVLYLLVTRGTPQ